MVKTSSAHPAIARLQRNSPVTPAPTGIERLILDYEFASGAKLAVQRRMLPDRRWP